MPPEDASANSNTTRDGTNDLRRAVEIPERFAHGTKLPRREAPQAFRQCRYKSQKSLHYSARAGARAMWSAAVILGGGCGGSWRLSCKVNAKRAFHPIGRLWRPSRFRSSNAKTASGRHIYYRSAIATLL